MTRTSTAAPTHGNTGTRANAERGRGLIDDRPTILRETEMSAREQGRRKATAVSAAHGAQPSAAAAKEECLLLRSSCCVVALADKGGLGLRGALSRDTQTRCRTRMGGEQEVSLISPSTHTRAARHARRYICLLLKLASRREARGKRGGGAAPRQFGRRGALNRRGLVCLQSARRETEGWRTPGLSFRSIQGR